MVSTWTGIEPLPVAYLRHCGSHSPRRAVRGLDVWPLFLVSHDWFIDGGRALVTTSVGKGLQFGTIAPSREWCALPGMQIDS